jgi:hypothetical protein
MRPAIEANSRELRLARRALRTAQTHLRNAVGLVTMPEATEDECRRDAIGLETWVTAVSQYEREANAYLSAKVASRRRRAR